ncbi:MAG: BrnA antitoxin family protein [Clostridiales bacterium]|nr:BrnA antitoxin family protein [Clostridiales bacterium]
MREEYDFSDAQPGRLTERYKQQITIRIDRETIAWFKELSAQTGVPYQTLMNQYLTDCAKKKKTPEFV